MNGPYSHESLDDSARTAIIACPIARGVFPVSLPRPDKANSAMRRLTIFCLAIFCLAVCLSRSTVLLAQTNNSSGLFGNRTTGGANQGTKASAGASGNRSTGGANPAPSGNIGSGTPGNSGGNFRSPGETGLGQTGSAAARRARLEASSAGGNKGQAQGGLTGGYIAPAGSYFVARPKPTASTLRRHSQATSGARSAANQSPPGKASLRAVSKAVCPASTTFPPLRRIAPAARHGSGRWPVQPGQRGDCPAFAGDAGTGFPDSASSES